MNATAGVFLADKSAWERQGHASVRAAWDRAVHESRIVTCAAVRYEILYSARDAEEYDAISAVLAAFRDLPLTASIHRAALGAMRELSATGPLHHRVPLPDLLIGAAAADAGVAVVHCDAHFDRIAAVLGFESRWLVPPSPG